MDPDRALEAVASMRPRFMNRGSSAKPSGARSKSSGFNEAPIHESGKWCRRAMGCARRGRFNEAPIHESGKYDSPHGLQLLTVASMRPRFMNRGSRHSSNARWHKGHASMRPRFMNRGSSLTSRPKSSARPSCFNEAPIHESGKWRQGEMRWVRLSCFNEAPIHESGKLL